MSDDWTFATFESGSADAYTMSEFSSEGRPGPILFTAEILALIIYPIAYENVDLMLTISIEHFLVLITVVFDPLQSPGD